MTTQKPRPEGATIQGLCRQYHNEDAHSMFVERLATQIFQGVQETLGLSPKDGEILSTAAILHDIGLEENPEEHNIRSREILLETGLSNLSPRRIKLIACLVTFHRDKVRWEEDDLFLSLDGRDRDRALKLSAILRVADGLDYTHGEAVAIESIREKRGRFVVFVTGRGEDLDANVARAKKKADLWRSVMPAPLVLVGSEPDAPAKKPDPPRVKRKHGVADSARRIMAFHFRQIQANERATRVAESAEALHDMRVATRRLRSALQAFQKAIGKERTEPYGAELRWVATALGEVRDLDVWIAYLEKYVQKSAPEHRRAIEEYIHVEKAERESHREQLVASLDSDRFRRLRRQFDDFLQEEPVPREADRRMGPYAAKSVRKRMKRALAFAEGIESAGEDRLHQLRIACKRLRYTAEFFAGCLGKQSRDMVAMLRNMQDALGAFHDTIVWRARIGEAASAPMRALREHLAGEAQGHRSDFLKVWERFAASRFQKALRRELRGAAN